MTAILQLQLSNELVQKLQEKNIQSFNEIETKAFNSITNGLNIALNSSHNMTSILVPLVKKLESGKKLKPSRKPKLIIGVGKKELCDQFAAEIKSLLTKELVVVSCHSGVSTKKNKKRLSGPVDVVIGTIDRLMELINSSVLNTKSVRIVIVSRYDEINAKETDDFLTKLSTIDKSSAAESNKESRVFQLIVTTAEFGEKIKSVFGKFSDGKFENIVDEDDNAESESDEEESEEADSAEDSDENVVKLNGDIKNEEEEKEESDKESEEIDEKVIERVTAVKNWNDHKKTAESIFKQFGDIESIARLIALLKEQCVNGTQSENVGRESGKSVLSNRSGYTAYYFRADKAVSSKGYLFKSLKRLIDEELVEKIERIRQTKDLHGFVFDLLSVHDAAFQEKWRDGKYDTMELLEGKVPELATESIGGSSGGPRGGGRGGFRGRGNDRGGGRGDSRGRFNDRGGRTPGKRPMDASDTPVNSKVTKFE